MNTKNTEEAYRNRGLINFYFLSVLVGLVAGFGAAIFRALIAFFHNLMFLGELSFHYNANIHTPASPWGAFVIAVPVVGALGVVFLVKNFAPEAKGHGVPEVMDAIYYNDGKIRPVVAVIKSLASALSIGSGGSVGREGPIIQIGSSFGSIIGQVIHMPIWQRTTLIAAGAGGGIAATFNTPVGGVLFAVEIMMTEVSVRTLVPVAISTSMATYVGRYFFGNHPSFIIPELEVNYFQLTHPWILISYVGLGIIIGVVSALYIKSIYRFEDLFEKIIKKNEYLRHTSGMLIVGIMMYLMFLTTGNYYIEGVGYAAIQSILGSKLNILALLLILFAVKLLAVSITLGSGASGGVFSPGLFMGAALGQAYGLILSRVFPSAGFSPVAFAVAGMAGVIGGTTGAALTAIVMIFEMTLDYNVIIPMTLTVALSYGLRRILSRESIYTLKLVRRGHYMPEALQTNFHHLKRVQDIYEQKFGVISLDAALSNLAVAISKNEQLPFFLVEENSNVVGFVSKCISIDLCQRCDMSAGLDEILDKSFISVPESATLFDVMVRMRVGNASVALVTKDGTLGSAAGVKGLITQTQIAQSLENSVRLFST